MNSVQVAADDWEENLPGSNFFRNRHALSENEIPFYSQIYTLNFKLCFDILS